MKWWLLIIVAGGAVDLMASGRRIWLIRHCDKPQSSSHCCSELGYKRAAKWGEYFKSKFVPHSKTLVVASDFNPTAPCPLLLLSAEAKFGTKKCQKSQRMVETAIEMGLAPGRIFHDYCVGQEAELVAYLKQDDNPFWDNAVVVWEHAGIVDILRGFGFKIGEWKHKWTDIYSLVFWIDLADGGWGVDCSELVEGECVLSNSVIKWLSYSP